MPRTELPSAVGRYMLVRRLAAGGMAEVYLGKAQRPGGFEKLVAVKRIHGGHSEAGPLPRALADEAKLSVALVHPNIVRTLDFGRAQDAEFIVMEHLDGCDVQQVLDAIRSSRSAFPVDLAAYVISQVCRGLHHAHQHRDLGGRRMLVVHRDVSPQNILLSTAGEVKIADFGIAKTRDRHSDPGAKIIKGKYFYMSPEQARAAPIDHRSDVFSAGVVLWELLVGERLYGAPDVRTLIERVQSGHVPAPSTRRPEVPHALDAIVARATRPVPSERYPDAASMSADLDAYLAARPFRRPAAQIQALLSSLDPPPRPDATAPLFQVPLTRDRVVTRDASGRATPTEPPRRHSIVDGSPTFVGWQGPPVRPGSARWLWAAAAGAASVVAVAWWLFGA